jgi:hypothetical protein
MQSRIPVVETSTTTFRAIWTVRINAVLTHHYIANPTFVQPHHHSITFVTSVQDRFVNRWWWIETEVAIVWVNEGHRTTRPTICTEILLHRFR